MLSFDKWRMPIVYNSCGLGMVFKMLLPVAHSMYTSDNGEQRVAGFPDLPLV